MNLPLGLWAEREAETATRTPAGERGSNASRTSGRQRRRNRSEGCPRPYAQSCMYVALRAYTRRRLSANSRPAHGSANLERARRAAASECRRPVRSAAARRSARARQRQDDAMTPAGPTDTTSAPSRASRCACVAAVASLSTEQDDCSFYRARDALLSERAR
eukprot:scaffold85693_cov69-Phaeocystis_antarctica.AAC.1